MNRAETCQLEEILTSYACINTSLKSKKKIYIINLVVGYGSLVRMQEKWCSKIADTFYSNIELLDYDIVQIKPVLSPRAATTGPTQSPAGQATRSQIRASLH